MKRRRGLAVVFAALCLGLAGLVLRQFRVPLVGPVAAQTGGGPQDAVGPMGAASAAVRKAAAASVKSQLEAFAKDDYAKAATYQSAGLRQNFPSVAAFRQMMTTQYPEFAHYKAVTFGAAQADAKGLHVVLPVTLTGQDGVTLKAVYLLVKEGKVYKVEGVQGGGRAPLIRGPGSSVDA